MKHLLVALFLGASSIVFGQEPRTSPLNVKATWPQFDAAAADRFAKLALACVGKEYPNKISHLLNSDADVAPPRKLTKVNSSSFIKTSCNEWRQCPASRMPPR